MTREEIINGLKMSMELTLFDPSTGEVMEPRQLNDINRTAYEAYKGAIELLEKQPDTTTHDSNAVKKGGNDEDRTSDDCIGRQQAIDKIKKRLFETAFNNIGIKRNVDDTLLDVAEDRLETWFDDVPSIQTDIIRCKDCVNYIDHRCVVADHHVAPFSCCQDVFNARKRGEQ